MADNEDGGDICGLCGEPGADKIPHPIHWPGEQVPETRNARRRSAAVRTRWHTFRHTYRSLLDEAGAPIGVQRKLMRHSNVATTMNVYGDSTLRAKRNANSKMVEMLIQAQPDRDLG